MNTYPAVAPMSVTPPRPHKVTSDFRESHACILNVGFPPVSSVDRHGCGMACPLDSGRETGLLLGRLSRKEVQPLRSRGGLQSIRYAELRDDVRDVDADRALADEQPPG